MKNRAVFLDRDWVINEEIGHIIHPNGIRILPGVPAAIKSLKEKGYRVIVVTNQGAIAKGLMTVDSVEIIHTRMAELLGKESAVIDGIYYCPHHSAGDRA